MSGLLRILAIVGIAVVGVAVTWMLGMRYKLGPVINAQRKLNRKVFNPKQMGTAGQPGSYAAIIRHVGRNSGTSYETPIGVLTVEDRFIVALPYGTSPDWLKNVMTAGEATLVHEGETFDVHRPELIHAAEANPLFSEKEQRSHRMFAIDDFLVLHNAA